MYNTAVGTLVSLTLLSITVKTLGVTEPILTLNIGGSLFSTSVNTLSRYPNCLIAQDYRPDRTSYFYDRDGELFKHILNYLRNGKLLLPQSFDQFDQLREEAKFFQLYTLRDEITELQDKLGDGQPANKKKHTWDPMRARPDILDETSGFSSAAGEVTFESVIVCADEDGKIERWFSAPVDLRFENNGCLLGDCDMMPGYSHILDYRDYTARPGNAVPDQFNIAAIVARLLKAGFELVSSSSGMDEWHREFYFVFIRKIKKF